ncbi:MAG: TVP38/TMEM64 family protein [Gemmatimonadetes bacterium]|nr:TVP38/TMEM64 family protein [Gemmatimonadota bacterium]
MRPTRPTATERTPPPARAARPGRKRWKRIALAVLLLGSLGAFFALGGPRYLSFETLKAHRDQLLAFKSRHFWAMLAGALVVYAIATALSFPGGVLMSLAVGFLFGRWVGTGVVIVAATAGATAAFLSARYLFADAARRRMGPRLKRLARGFEEDAFNYLLFVRLVPVFPFWLMNLVPAFTPVRTRTFVTATAIGILPGSFVFTSLGESLLRIHSARDLLSAGVLLSFTMLGVLSLVPVVVKKVRRRKKVLSAES